MPTLSARRPVGALHRTVFALSLLAGVLATSNAFAQTPVNEIPANVVNLSASGHLEVPQDWLTVVLNTTREGSDPVTVQNQLKQAVDAALALAQPQARPKEFEVRTGNLRLYPRYSSAGRISGWQGQAEVVLEGRDVAAISGVAGRVQTLTVANMGFSLSRESRQALESQVQAQAIERFRARASEIAKGFGFGGYTLRDISVSSADTPERPMPRMMAMEAKAASSDAPIPVAAGTATVSITVSGAVQMR